jgi:hypothetical protein
VVVVAVVGVLREVLETHQVLVVALVVEPFN